jgi:thioredoxin-like negative regulator of GroEL
VEEVARNHAGTIVALTIDTAQDPVPAIVHGIQGARTFVLFRDGHEVTRCRGPLPRAAFEKWVHSAAAC